MNQTKKNLSGANIKVLEPILNGLLTPIIYYLDFSEESMKAYKESNISSLAQMFSLPDRWIREVLPISSAKQSEAKQLFNLESDPYEKDDLSSNDPKSVNKLNRLLNDYLKTITD